MKNSLQRAFALTLFLSGIYSVSVWADHTDINSKRKSTDEYLADQESLAEKKAGDVGKRQQETFASLETAVASGGAIMRIQRNIFKLDEITAAQNGELSAAKQELNKLVDEARTLTAQYRKAMEATVHIEAPAMTAEMSGSALREMADKLTAASNDLDGDATRLGQALESKLNEVRVALKASGIVKNDLPIIFIEGKGKGINELGAQALSEILASPAATVSKGSYVRTLGKNLVTKNLGELSIVLVLGTDSLGRLIALTKGKNPGYFGLDDTASGAKDLGLFIYGKGQKAVQSLSPTSTK